jgi:hypothetical protein
MIYGKERAQIDDEHGKVQLTVCHDPVSIKQGGDLIRLSRPGARELAADLVACLDALEAGQRSIAMVSRVRGVGRDASDESGRTLFVSFDAPPSDDELRAFHDFIGRWRT